MFVTQEELKGLGWAIYLTREKIEDEPVLIILGDTILRLISIRLSMANTIRSVSKQLMTREGLASPKWMGNL